MKRDKKSFIKELKKYLRQNLNKQFSPNGVKLISIDPDDPKEGFVFQFPSKEYVVKFLDEDYNDSKNCSIRVHDKSRERFSLLQFAIDDSSFIIDSDKFKLLQIRGITIGSGRAGLKDESNRMMYERGFDKNNVITSGNFSNTDFKKIINEILKWIQIRINVKLELENKYRGEKEETYSLLDLENHSLFKMSMGVFVKNVIFQKRNSAEYFRKKNWIVMHKDTGKVQGERFITSLFKDEFVYVCYGSNELSYIAKIISDEHSLQENDLKFVDGDEGWLYREVEPLYFPINNSVSELKNDRRLWMPSGNSTLFEIPENELDYFNKVIGLPKYNVKIIKTSSNDNSNCWIFQCNPNAFDFEKAIRNNLLDSWTVTAHKDKIKIGDKIILWISGKESGCYALAEITSEPQINTKSKDSHLWKTEDKNQLKAGIKITHNLIDSPLLWNKIKGVIGLENLKVGNQGTNFSATKNEFKIISDLINDLTGVKNNSDMHAKNIILYGPPGTGKTYNSIDKAVEIATGKSGVHSDNKKVFDELRSKGQIEFVTFHQNYSYEDFMVGLRPDIENEQLRFRAYKGIFYEIAKRARENYLASKEHTALAKTFDEVFNEIIKPLVEENKGVEIKMASGIKYTITDVSETTIHFKKPSGGTQHTLSIQTLEDVVEGTKKVSSGLAAYYYPLVNLILEKRKPLDSTEKEKEKNFVLVIDEINRANISKVFGELITLLEDDKRLGEENELKISLPNGEKEFGVPPNLYIIGTMNTADKSIALIDIALRRRFEFIGKYPEYTYLNSEESALLQRINEAIFKEKKSADFLIGHAYFMKQQQIVTVLNNKVVPLLMEYFSGKTDIVSNIFSLTDWSVTYNSTNFSWNISPK